MYDWSAAGAMLPPPPPPPAALLALLPKKKQRGVALADNEPANADADTDAIGGGVDHVPVVSDTD